MFGGLWRRGSVWPWCALGLASSAAVGAIAWEVWPRTVDLSLVRPRVQGTRASSASTSERARVRLFFPHEAMANLVEEERAVPRRSALADRVREVLQGLTLADGKGAVPPCPPAAQLRRVFLDQFGILYLDFNKGIEALATGDGGRAALAVSAIVLSLATNFSEVKRVQFLTEGHDWSAQVGTVDLRRPLQPQFLEEQTRSAVSKPPEGKL